MSALDLRTGRIPPPGTIHLLRTLAMPGYEVKLTRARAAQELRDARLGLFDIYGRRVALVPPVDWNQAGTRSWHTQLHSWVFMDVLLQMYLEGDEAAFGQALHLALDWIASQRRASSGSNPLAWYNKVVGDRSPYVAYLLRAGASAGLLSDEQANELLASFIEHGRFLEDEANYAKRTNHGLYQDAGLLLLAKYGAGFLPEADTWRAKARRRFGENFAALYDAEDALYLEHSTAYHYSLITLVTRLCKQGLLDVDEFGPLVARMRESGSWFVMPDGMLTQIGDTDLSQAMPWALREAAQKSGLRLFPRAGYAVVKENDSYLVVAASFHGVQHKHSDELSFELYERERVVCDPGRYAYEEGDSFRQFAQSACAHSVLLLDDVEFSFKGREPFGSGILAGGEGAGWYGVLARNPLVADLGASHLRLFLYLPGRALLILDQLGSWTGRSRRLLHLAPGISASGDGAVRLEGARFRGTLRDHSAGGSDVLLRRGRESPPIQGWHFPSERRAEPATVVELTQRESAPTLVTALELGEDGLQIVAVEWNQRDVAVGVVLGTRRSCVSVKQVDSALDIREVR